jgi:RNA polymerase sigma-70 factor (ECF subfamily)
MTSLAHNTTLHVGQGLPDTEPRGLLARLRMRDESALAQLARAYAPALTRAAYLHLGDAHAAEDAVQDALIAAWDAAGRTSDQTPLWPWLLGIVFNGCRKQLRSLSRRRRRERRAFALRQLDAGRAPEAHDADQLHLMRAALLDLAEPLRCVVILRYEQGLSVTETAAALELPEGTVKRRCHDAIQKLRFILRSVP